MNLLMIEALKLCGDCACILSAISKTSLAEKFRGAIPKSPLKVKEKNIKFDPELQNNYPEYRCHEQGIPLSFCHVIQLSTKKRGVIPWDKWFVVYIRTMAP